MTSITVTDNNTSIVVSPQVYTFTLTTNAPAGLGLTYYRYTGSQFDGVSGDSGRTVVLPNGGYLRSTAIVSIGGRFMDSVSDFSFDTDVVLNDTLVVTGPLMDDDVVLIWT